MVEYRNPGHEEVHTGKLPQLGAPRAERACWVVRSPVQKAPFCDTLAVQIREQRYARSTIHRAALAYFRGVPHVPAIAETVTATGCNPISASALSMDLNPLHKSGPEQTEEQTALRAARGLELAGNGFFGEQESTRKQQNTPISGPGRSSLRPT